jgi:hypothetical protein
VKYTISFTKKEIMSLPNTKTKGGIIIEERGNKERDNDIEHDRFWFCRKGRIQG